LLRIAFRRRFCLLLLHLCHHVVAHLHHAIHSLHHLAHTIHHRHHIHLFTISRLALLALRLLSLGLSEGDRASGQSREGRSRCHQLFPIATHRLTSSSIQAFNKQSP